MRSVRCGDGALEFILHKRNHKATATFAGHFMVAPIGIFQPSTQSPAARQNDFSIWRMIMGEFNEEILGNPEADGTSGATVDYSYESPYAELEQARTNGDLAVFYLGLGPTELSAQMLSALVIDESLFATTDWQVADRNPEGLLVGHSRSAGELTFIPFVASEVNYHLDLGSLSPASHACLALAWEWREHLHN